jgi:hypothetical protein
MENREESQLNSEMIVFSLFNLLSFPVFHVFSLLNLLFFHIFHIISHFNLLFLMGNDMENMEERQVE